MQEILILVALLNAALLTGNEFAVGVFIHPALNRLAPEFNVRGLQSIAKIYGAVMPFWMSSVALSCIALLFVAPFLSTAWQLFLGATVLFSAAIIFSIIFPLPINNQTVEWNPSALPDDWQELRNRFDRYHIVRIVILLVGLSCVILGVFNF